MKRRERQRRADRTESRHEERKRQAAHPWPGFGKRRKETDRGVKEEVLNSFFIQGNAAAIVAVARNEKDAELKRVAVSKLSIMHSKEATDYLMEILQK